MVAFCSGTFETCAESSAGFPESGQDWPDLISPHPKRLYFGSTPPAAVLSGGGLSASVRLVVDIPTKSY